MPHMIAIKLRRGTALRWLEINPTLAAGEPGYELDTGKMKIGDGITRWSDLGYFVPTPVDYTPSTTLAEHENSDLPHPVYDDGPSFTLLYENAKV